MATFSVADANSDGAEAGIGEIADHCRARNVQFTRSCWFTMRALLAAALLVAQPEPRIDAVNGVVLRPDGTGASNARVELRCGDWRQALVSAEDGTFAFPGAPQGPCTLAAQSADDPSAGVSLDLPAAREGRVSVILPAGLTKRSTVSRKGLEIDLTSEDTASTRRSLRDRTQVSGLASSSGLDLSSPGARPGQWSVATTVTRPGPWGTLFTGSASARRQVGPSTLLSDVAGVVPPGSSMWSVLFDPTRPTMLYDVRVGLMKELSLGGTKLTFFGEAYQSFQGGSAEGEFLPLPESATKGLRSGTAGRFGVKLGF